MMALALVPTLAAGAARAQVRVASATTTTAPPALDSAIANLQGFLARYPDSPLRPNALFELGELLVRRADEQFAESQRAGEPAAPAATDTTTAAAPTAPAAAPRPAASAASASAPVGADYSAAISRYNELVTRYPRFEQIDAAEYTLGTLYAFGQQYANAAAMFERVAADSTSAFRPEALFRLGDARFELASREKGDTRRAIFGQAAQAYEQAVAVAPQQGDIYFLSLYKLGWSYYNQANLANQADYQRAVDVFGRLVDAYDKLTPEQQSRLGLRGEAIEYMAIAFTQVGGSAAADRYFAQHGGFPYKVVILRRVAQSLRDQGSFPEAIQAYQTVLAQAPTDSSVLNASREIVDIYQNRMLQPDSAQIARLALVDRLAPGSAWAQANPQLADSAAALRETMLRQAGQYVLAAAQAGNRARFPEAAQIYQRYLTDFPKSDSAEIVNRYYAEALFGAGDYARAGAEFSRTAYGYGAADSTLAQEAGRNAIVAFDSALVRNKTDRGAQDSLFAAVDHFVAAFPNTDVAKRALIEEGRRASETQRWDVMARSFQTYAAKYPGDPYTPTAQRLIGDALYRSGQYAQAQTQWEQAQQVASTSGRRALADSIARLRTTAAESYADSLIKAGNYKQAAEEVYVAYAKNNPKSEKAADALRNAIETYMLADSAARARNDQGASTEARQRAIDLSAQLAQQYPDYKYRLQYQTLRARLLDETGKRDESVAAYQELIAQNPRWSGRPDAMVRVAVMLDSLGKKTDAATAYEAFANAYPKDDRAAGALWNSAATFAEAKDYAAAARSYAEFAQRYPRDDRASQARAQQVTMLQQSGDSTAANAALASACARPSDALRAECASRVAQRSFAAGVATFSEYQPLKLTLTGSVTKASVTRASARKLALLKQLTAQFSDAIKSGVPVYIAAGSYYVGLAQWNYGNFLKNVELPGSLTDVQRTAAQQGAATQAEQYFANAKQIWQELVQKAESTPEIQKDDKATAWVQRARDAVQGNVDTTPPSVTGGE